jgi:hypothetical protein
VITLLAVLFVLTCPSTAMLWIVLPVLLLSIGAVAFTSSRKPLTLHQISKKSRKSVALCLEPVWAKAPTTRVLKKLISCGCSNKMALSNLSVALTTGATRYQRLPTLPESLRLCVSLPPAPLVVLHGARVSTLAGSFSHPPAE